MLRSVILREGNGFVSRFVTLFACSVLLGAGSASAQSAEEVAEDAAAQSEIEAEYQAMLEELEKVGWQREGTGDLKEAEIEIPEGFRFTGPDGAREILEMTGNIPSGSELGILAPSDHFDYWVLLRFDEIGYVKDDEKDEIDADDMMAKMKEGEGPSNERRREMGLDELYFEGWALPPRYNEETNNLEWAIRLRSSEGGESVNFKTNLLGRYGVTDVVLVCDSEQLEELMPLTQELMAGFTYKDGKRYAEFKDGDKIAEYGLTALVLGGAGVLAAKAGLFAVIAKFFAKAGKLVIAGLVAIGIFIRKLFGRKENPYQG